MSFSIKIALLVVLAARSGFFRMRAVLVFLAVILTPFFPASANDFDNYIMEGDEYFSSFDNHSALNSYLDAYKLDPDSYAVLYRLARSYNDLGEEYYEYRKKDSSEIMIKKAIEFSEKLKNHYPDSAASYAYLAMSYGNQALYEGGKGKIKLAHKIEENAKKSLNINPSQYLSYIILGIYYRQIADLSWFERIFANTFFGDVPEGTFNQSVEMFKKALDVKPGTIVASYQLALTYGLMGQKEKEKKLLQELLTYPQKNFRDKFAIRKAKKRLKDLG